MYRVIVAGLISVLAGCAAMSSATPEQLAALEAQARACGDALPAIDRYEVDRFGSVRASAQGPEAEVIERNFLDCIGTRGRWATWAPGQPAPMLDPPGTDDPTPSPALRVP